MSRGGKASSLLLPWAAMIAAGLAWAIQHQTGSNLSFSDCNANGAVMTGLLGLGALILTGIGAFLSWREWKRGDAETEGRTFVSMVGFLFALLLGLAIILQTLAAFILPACFA